MLKNWRDIQSLIYLIAQPALVLYCWKYGFTHWFSYVVYACVLFLSVGISAVHHNHAHVPMWRNKTLNRITNWWLTVLQGHPTFVFYASHNANHHRYHHGELDVARTYRFGGDTNNLWGYISHPFFAIWVLYPLFLTWLTRIYYISARLLFYFLSHYLLILALWISLASIHFYAFLMFILLPQLFGLHWLLATNYLQHAHADGQSTTHFSRNFEGWVNFFCLNIGLHTAHHLHPRVHWSSLPNLHNKLKDSIHPQLHAGPLFAYMFRTYILSIVLPRYRSKSLMLHHSQVKPNSNLSSNLSSNSNPHSKDHLCL